MVQDAAAQLDYQNKEISELDKLINESAKSDQKGSKRTTNV